MKIKMLTTLLVLLLASGIGCGQQQDLSSSDATETTPSAPAPAPEPASGADPATTASESPAEDPIAAGEVVEETAEDAAPDASQANLLLAQAVAPPAAEPNSRWKRGTHYSVIIPATPTGAPPDKVKVIEVFWYGCPHCYGLEPYLQNWMPKKAHYVDFERIPVTWGPVHKLHAQLYYTLMALEREDLHIVAFRESQVGDHLMGRNAADTERVHLAFAKRHGVDGDVFLEKYRSQEVAKRVEAAAEFVLRHRIEEVPRLVINGKYMADVGSAGGPGQLISMIDDLAAREHKKE